MSARFREAAGRAGGRGAAAPTRTGGQRRGPIFTGMDSRERWFARDCSNSIYNLQASLEDWLEILKTFFPSFM